MAAEVVVYRTTPAPRTEVGRVPVGTLQLDVDGLTPDTEYAFVAQKRDGALVSPDSNTATVKPPKQRPHINPPTSLHITATSTTTLTVAWVHHPGDGVPATSFLVEWTGPDGVKKSSNPLATDVRSFTIGSLTAGTAYKITVTALAEGVTAQSAVLEATTTAEPTTVNPTTNLVSTSHTETSIGVAFDWEKGEGLDADEFDLLYRIPPETTWTDGGTVAKGQRIGTITGLTSDTGYEITVQAVHNGPPEVRGTGPVITERTLAPAGPEPPTGVTINESDPGSEFQHEVHVSWTAPASGPRPDKYALEVTEKWDGSDKEFTRTTEVTGTSGGGLVNAPYNTLFSARVRSHVTAALDWSTWSEPGVKKTVAHAAPHYPANVKVDGDRNLTWFQYMSDAVPTQYEVEYFLGYWRDGGTVAFVRSQLTYSMKLPDEATGTVRVRARSGSVVSDWSTVTQ
ncbi:fibronectin type III domain-containing protein [Streptomyces alboflavus]|uniref:fibronectin type III domain-containing protein n=1 Tax=Streptomyces alboflavus TaxID=67267 RepID=UPI00369BAFB7